MLKKIGITTLALAGVLAFATPRKADAAVRFGVGFSGPVYTYPAYPYPAYPYPYSGYYGYPPAYAYPGYGIGFGWGGGWGGHWGGAHWGGHGFHGRR